MIKKTQSKFSQIPLLIKRKKIRLKMIRKKPEKLLFKNLISNAEFRAPEGLTDSLSQSYDDLGFKIQQQAHEIKIKNIQLRNGEEKQIRSKKQIHILTKAMESTAEGIFIIDAQNPDFPIVYANHSFKKMTGFAKGKILGGDYFSPKGTDDDLYIINKIKQTLHRGKSFNEEILTFKKKGKKYWNLLRITPMHDPDKNITHYIGIQTDITLIKEKELEIDEKREELLHVTRVGKLAEFVSSLAHEISQPLTAILSYAQAAQRMLKGNSSKIHEIFQYIIDDDNRAAQVIARLRLLLKKSKPEMKPLDINTLIHETVLLIITDATVRNDSLKLELESSLPFIHGDRIQLQQVLLNLVSNSFEAMEKIQDKREILIRTLRKDSHTIIVEVKDTGCGISSKNIPKLFTRFYTSKPDGLGMGLSISRSIIESHGGRLDVKNNPDRGVTFYFTLPTDMKEIA